MPRIGCNRLRFVSVLPLALVLTVLGCQEDAQSPTAPDAGPALAKRPADGLLFRQVSAGFHHSCGVTSDNRAYCWGQNLFGQLGDGTTSDQPTPVAVGGGLEFRQVSAGARHTCGVTRGYVAYCWGSNASGQLGDGTITNRLTPVAVAGGLRFRQVSASANGDHTCGVTPGNVAYCWGSNFNAQLGDGTTNNFRPTPVAVAGGLRFRQVSVGGVHTCGVATGNLAYCWGDNEFGQLGDGTTITRRTPVAVAGGLRFSQVSAGENFHSCGVTSANRAYCWGTNFNGELGDGTTTDRLTPVAVVGGLQFRQVSAGLVHTCGVATGDLAYCWGYNGFGALGDGTTSPHFTPVAVAAPAP
jgi:alpha-tubulin suppressor-like RCC1 family protein